MKKITPFLWFNDNAEKAAKFYVSIFKKSKITKTMRTRSTDKIGRVTSVSFTLDGQDFMALNGGPVFTFTPAISLFVDCKTQKEVDTLSKKLSKDGAQLQCGWVRDQFGMSWQIVPSMLSKVLYGKDPKKSAAAMKAMMGMHKLNIKQLQDAYDNA